jgi:plasmid maintenance system antidote protein VapI
MTPKWLTPSKRSVIIHTMDNRPQQAPISDRLRQRIVESGLPYLTLEKETGVARASIMRFVRGDHSLRLDKADRLAAFFGLELQERQ